MRPTTGIRLRTVSRQNASEADPRSMGGKAQGALAFRLLQRDWNLVLGIEKLDPWVTGQVLHEITLREGQTRSALIASFNVQNASIRKLPVILPITNADEIKTLRASGDIVSDLIRTAPDSNTWEIQFTRRVVGRIDFRIEYERRGERENEDEILSPAGFPEARQLSYFFGIRAGGRLELEHDTLSQGWQRADWNTVPQALREAGNRNAPALALRAVAPANVLKVHAKRHSLADALKLRVAAGSLTTILSPTGDQLTAVELTMEVIQRSSLSVGLPDGGELFSIFVNGESVNSIRQEGKTNAWQFYILPGIDDRTAKVRFVYSLTGDRLTRLKLSSPQLNNNRSDAALVDNKQLREAAAENPVLQQDQLNFRPQQLSQLLRGNTTEDNAVLQQIAGRLVQHQRTTEPAPQAIIISLPEEGAVYTFSRSVQVAENAPLELDLHFGSQFKLQHWQTALVLALFAVLATTLAFVTKRREAA